jgi:hypothetical protein
MSTVQESGAEDLKLKAWERARCARFTRNAFTEQQQVAWARTRQEAPYCELSGFFSSSSWYAATY